MNIEFISKKIERILNDTDSEVAALELSTANPKSFLYQVETTGFHLDHIMNKVQGLNFIPVFISSMGGNMNPVPDLKQGNYNIPIVFYFPVRFKNDMFKLYDYLASVFVGRTLNYANLDGIEPYNNTSAYSVGTKVQKGGKVYECNTAIAVGGENWNPAHWTEIDRCISNISVPSFGEIQGLDLKEFVTWVANRYQAQIQDNNQPILSMQINLYLTNAADEFVYGNDVEISLTLEDSEIAAEKLVFASGAMQSASQSQSEQELGVNETEGIPTATTTGFSVAAYVKSNAFYNAILNTWFSDPSGIQEMRFTASISIGSYTYTRYAFVESVNMPIRKGELLTVTFSFGKAIDFRENVGG